MSHIPDNRSDERDVDRMLVDYLAIIIEYSALLLRQCGADDDVRRREIEEIYAAADAAVHLVSRKTHTPDEPGDQELRGLEREHILRVLAAVRGNKVAAAKRLGISRRTLYRRLVRHGLMSQPPGSGLSRGVRSADRPWRRPDPQGETQT